MQKNSPKFFIISGTSGSGKSIALQVLEDLGFYCIDNLPASLVTEFAARVLGNDTLEHNCAISIDARNQDSIGNLQENLDSLNALNMETRLIFLDANDASLLKRYSETRRKHPLSNAQTSLSEAIKRERKLLSHIAKISHRSIDTSTTTPHELRTIIRNESQQGSDHALTLQLQSFGFKYGNPNDVDYIFDVRCLPNPHWQKELKPLNGMDEAVQKFLLNEPLCELMFEQIRDFISQWLPHFMADNRNYITIGIGCTGGQHRSVYLSEKLMSHFRQNEGIQTLVRHRELQ